MLKKTKLALAFAALGLAAGQSALAAEFTVSGTIDNIYSYYGDDLPALEYGDKFEVTVTYEDNPGAPDYSNTYTYADYNYGYTQTQSEWYDSIQSIAVAVHKADGSMVYSQTITPGQDGVTYSYNNASSYTIDYSNYYEDYQQVYFQVYNETYNGQLNAHQQVQVYFWGYTLDLTVDHSQFPQPPDQAMLDNGQVRGRLWTWDYIYNYDTGTYHEWYFEGNITTASGMIITDPDADGDGIPDDEDAFPNDPTESADSDGDGVGDNADAFPNDPAESADSDGDGVGDNADAFPNDPAESADSDGDGVGDNADQNDNSDLSATVSIDGNNSGVTNTLVRNGLSLADIINTAGSACKMAAKNHGGYVSCVGKTLNSLTADGTITDAQKDVLQSTVARSKTGKK